MAKKSTKKIAIVSDWLTSIGGAERVLLAMHELYPDAPIYTSQYDPKKINWFDDADVKTTWLQSLPKKSTVRKLLPVLRRQAFQHIDLTQYDIIISSSGAEAKAVKKLKKGATHITYCHAPTHYYWSRYQEYLKEPGFGMLNPVARAGLKIFGGRMRKWDYKVAQRPDVLIANSNHIKQKIEEYYDRDAIVIHPPVDIDRFSKYAPVTKRKGLIITGRQVPYKRFDLAIAAAKKLNMPLTVIGNGSMHKKLVAQAAGHKNITFLTNVTDTELPKLLSKAELFVFPGVEDFGIAPVEAMAAGTPVVAYGEGGALDYVTDATGVLFHRQTADALADAIVTALGSKWDHKKIGKEVKKFNNNNFKKQFSAVVKQYL
ncbi:MAG TPA: glycosyltransferase [Candidatus Saccharibacteria bacterium]|nr:glycosyltransferase [Candidatus Saccharibacteria bacterium]MCB9817689.1 glycosyltransferase [Candidatus Nomurabacteria bacterium]HPD98907.1 glycosyltransferase [Candidatus Saccharibacteria bacterium]HPR10417.1 glycosyltransferase [Candidatus Saccharibacteria bacterium]